MPSSSTTTSKSVAFSSSLCQTQDGKVKIIEKDDENLDDESGSTYPRRTSIPDSDTDASRDKQVLFSGLYPVVMVGLKQTTRPRIWCLRMIENPWFERLSMMVIIMNCVTLGLYEPCEHKNSNHCNTQKCSALEICDHFVFAFFAVEMLIKMVAMGVWGKLGYLGDKWNRLDAAIVLFGIVEYAVQSEGSINFTAIRTIRVLRPLRAINRIASMRILVMLLLDTLPMLGNVLLLCSFVFFIFGIVSVQLWSGLLRQRCFLDDTFIVSGDDVVINTTNTSIPIPPYYMNSDEEAICSRDRDSGAFKCTDRRVVLPYKVENLTCTLNSSFYDPDDPIVDYFQGNKSCVDWNQYYRVCREDGGNPFQGAINFDNIMYAWVAIFQVISLEGWVDIMYFVMDAYSFYSFIYFILLIVVGSFFMINLCLVVIATQFSETKQREQRLIEEQRLRFKSNDSTLASYTPPGNTYEEILKYISHLYRKNKRKIMRRWRVWKQSREKTKPSSTNQRSTKSGRGSKKGQSIHLHHHHHHHHHHYHISNSSGSNTGEIVLDSGKHVVNVGVDVHQPHSPSISPTRLMLTDGRADSINLTNDKNRLRLPFSPISDAPSIHSISGSVTSERNSTLERRRSGEVVVEASGAFFFKPVSEHTGNSRSEYMSGCSSPHHFGEYVTSNLNCSCPSYNVTNPKCFESGAEEAVDDVSKTPRQKKKCLFRCFQITKEKVGAVMSETSNLLKRIVDSSYYQHFIMGAILVNTLSMGIEHHNQPETLTKILEISNVVFTTIFALEMISKLIAYGLLGYIGNLYNVFDAGIVIISVWEIAADSEDTGNGGLSVLRTFRLLRVLKLVRFLPALRRQLVVLMKTMDNVATFMMLLTLFIFIFSILGMHLFGCKFCRVNKYGHTECDRKNFDTLLWACVTVFQILTQEDWNMVLYNGMEAIGPFAAIYFITLMTIGNYVLFNLLVAILVEGFQAECYSGNGQKPRSGSRRLESDESSPILAQKYTEKIAHSLGFQTNSRKTHHDVGDDDETEELRSEESITSANLKFVHHKPTITLTHHESGSRKTSKSSGTIYQSVPIITHTAATPTNSPTPGGSPSVERLGMNEAVDEPGSLHETGSVISGSSGQRASIKSSQLSPNIQLNIHTLPRRRSTSSESRRSSVSSTSSRSGSWILRKSKPLPLDQQSLVSWEDDVFDNDSFSGNGAITCDDVSVNFDGTASKLPYEINMTSFGDLCRTSGTDDQEIENDKSNQVLPGLSASCCICHVTLPYWTFHRRDWPLYLIPPNSLFRRSVNGLVTKKWFDNIILLFIFANCVTIAMERPTLNRDSAMGKTLDILNYIFTVVFTIEMLLKVMANGFFIGENAYLKSGWNVLDCFLVVTSLIDIVMTLATENGSSVLGILRVFRLLRALRPLRVISRAPGLKLVVQTLISSLKPIGNIVLICCAFFIIFGILGVQIFKGKFYHCNGDDVRNVTNSSSCKSAGYEWINRRYNFDNLGQALMSLFVLSSKDGWVEIMYNGIDAVGVDQQPITNHKPVMILYFISFLLIVGFFVINMFVGVVVENFHRCREEHEEQESKRKQEAKKRKEEKHRRKQELRQFGRHSSRKTFRRRTLSRVRYRVDGVKGRLKRWWRRFVKFWKSKASQDNSDNYGSFRSKVYRFCKSKYFELGISAIIGINIITMAVEHYNQPPVLEIALKYANYVFTGVFVLEAAVKLYALGIIGYFRNLWNHMDMAIVILSVVGIVIEDAATASGSKLPINPTIVRFMRVLRIARVLKLLKVSKGIRSLLETVFRALPQVGNLGLLFMLLFFIFAALGVELFGTIKCNEDYPCEGLNRLANFENFGIALLTLFRISTGDNWNGIMKDTLRAKCIASDSCVENCCVSSIISPIYFVTFVMMAQFVLVNVVIAVLMKQLEDSRADDSIDDDDDNDVSDSDDDEADYDDNDDDDKVKEENVSDDREDVIADVCLQKEDVPELVEIENDSSSASASIVKEKEPLQCLNTATSHEKTKLEKPKQISEFSSTTGEPAFLPSSGSERCSRRHDLEISNIALSTPSSYHLLVSNPLHASGCKSTSATPARTVRYRSLPVRTKSLNLPGSDRKRIYPSHLPLHPCHSDPSPPRNLISNDSVIPPSKRRIERHLSDNPMFLRPEEQVHHYHHYHLPSQPLSKSAIDVSTSYSASASVDSSETSGSNLSNSLSVLSSISSTVVESKDNNCVLSDESNDKTNGWSVQTEKADDEIHRNEVNVQYETLKKIPSMDGDPALHHLQRSESIKKKWIQFNG